MDLIEFGDGAAPYVPRPLTEEEQADAIEAAAIIKRNMEQADLDALVARKVRHVPEMWDDEAWASDEWVDNERWHASPVPTTEAVVTQMVDVKASKVEWLWEHRIPQGALAVIDGDPGIGKSTITLDLAARITSGRPMPDGTVSAASGGSVLLLGQEDALGYTVRPRLEAAGADLTKVHALVGVFADGQRRPLVLPEDTLLLERAILNTAAKFVIIDPIMSYLSSDINSNSDQEVRRVLTPLAKVAEDTAATVLLVRHLRKTNDGPALYQGGGSIGIVGAARAGLIVVRDPRDPYEVQCILKQSKTNLGPWPRPIGYSLQGSGRDAPATVVWAR